MPPRRCSLAREQPPLSKEKEVASPMMRRKLLSRFFFIATESYFLCFKEEQSCLGNFLNESHIIPEAGVLFVPAPWHAGRSAFPYYFLRVPEVVHLRGGLFLASLLFLVILFLKLFCILSLFFYSYSFLVSFLL